MVAESKRSDESWRHDLGHAAAYPAYRAWNTQRPVEVLAKGSERLKYGSTRSLPHGSAPHNVARYMKALKRIDSVTEG